MRTTGVLTGLLINVLGVLDLATVLSGGQITRTGVIVSGAVICLCGTGLVALSSYRKRR